MQVGDLVKMRPLKQNPIKTEVGWIGQDDFWKGTVGIITRRCSESDEALFVMMTHDPAKKSLETIVVREEDVEVLREGG